MKMNTHFLRPSRQQKKQRSRRRPSALAGSIAALMLCVAPSASAANGTWNGTAVDSLWGSAGNWTGGIPGTGDTATFNGAGGGFTTISLGGGVTVSTILFDTASAAAYTIGAGAVNSETLTLNNGGAITMTGSVLQDELVNAAILLGTDATAQSYTFTNNSATKLLTLAGTITGGSGGAAGAKTLTVTGAGNTLIGGAIANGGATSVALTKSGAGNLTLRGINTYTGLTTIQGGTLTLDSNLGAGSIAGAALTFSGGGGTFDYLGAAAGSTQAFSGALTFSAGAGNVRSTFGGGNTSITFGSLAARAAGATGNFVISGGANGTTNKIVLGGQATGFINQGTFFNGSSYAYYDAGGFVRGINYGIDGGTATTGAGATIGALGGNHVQVTGSISGQTDITINTLNLSGADRYFVLGAPTAQTLTLTNGGILKGGGGASQISGGTVAAGAAELVIRADLATDSVKIDSVISGSGGLTVTGAGKVYLTGANTFTGNVNIDGGTVVMNFAYSSDVANPLGAAGARTITLNGGGTLQLNGSTYNPASTTVKGFTIGAGGGTFNISSGQLQFDDASQFSGTGDLTVNSVGNGIFFVGAAAVGYTGFTGNVTINGGVVKAFNVSSLGNTVNRSITVNSGGSLDVEVAAFNPGAGTTITLNGHGLNNTGALQNLAALVTTIAGNITLASNASVGSASTGGIGLSGVISGGFSLTKVGVGTGAVTLSGLNTYTGKTIVNAGTLIADSTINPSPINSASGLVFSGTGTFRYTGAGGFARNMTLNGLTLAGGAGILDSNNTGLSTTLTLGSITRATGGGSVDFRATTGTVGTNALANFAGQTLVSGIIGGFATVNSGANLATLDGSKNVVAYAAYTDINTNGSVIPNGAANNVRIATTAGAGNVTIGAGTTDANVLFQNTVTPVTVDTSTGILRLGSQGGIITSSAASTTGTVTIGTAANSGTLTAGGATDTSGEIIVNTALATPVTINATIADNGLGAVSLSRTGATATTLTLNGTNTYSGSTSINSGTLVIGTAGLANVNVASAIGKGSAGGSAADLVLNGGILQYALNTAPQSTDRLFSVGLGNGTIDSSSATAANALSFTGTGAIGFNGQSGSRTLTLTGTNTGNNLLAAVLGDNGGPTHLTKSAAGTWILTGNNSYTGTTTVSAGVLMVGNGSTTGSLGTGYIAGTGGTITFNHSDNVTLNNLIIGGTIRQATAATLSLNNAANSVTTLAFVGADGGVIDLLADLATNNAGAVGILATNSGTINATGGGRLIINSTSSATNGQDWGAASGKTLTINAVIANGISNNIDIFQAAASTGVTILTADNTFTGAVNIQGNTLQVARIGNQGTAAPVGAGTTIGINGTGGTGLRYTGTGETTDRIINLFGTTSAGFIEQSGVSGLLKFTANFATPGAGAKLLTLQGSAAGAGEIAGIILDNSANVNTTAITKAGTGTWTLSGANTYTGATTVSTGALILANALAMQNSVATISTVANTTTTGLVFGPGIGSFSIGGLNGTQNLALTDSASVALTALTIGGTNTSNGTYSGILSGTTNLTKAGPSTQTFTGINTFTGKMTVNAGTIAINAETGLGANPGAFVADQLTLNGGALSAVANAVFTIDDTNRGITIGASGGTFDAQGGAVMTISESIAGGTNTVTKSGPGVVIFTQPNTYGATVITGGRLMLSGAGTVGSGPVTVNGGGYVVSGPGAVTAGSAASGSSLIYTQTGSGTDVSGTLTLTNGGTLTVDVVSSAGTVNFASAFGGGTTAGLSKVGLGTLTLQGGTTGNTFTGTTTAGAGNLVLDFATVSAPASGVNSLSSPLSFRGGTLTLLGLSGTTDFQTFAGTALLEGGSTLTATQNGATSLGASLGAIARDGTTNKGTINFVLPTTGNYTTTSTNNTSGILGGWATVGGTAWAMASGGNIASYAGEIALPVTGGSATVNYSYNTTTAITGNLTANAIKFTTTGLTIALGTNNLTLTGNSGGLLLGLAAGTITGTTTTTATGFINAGASGELMVYTNAGSTLTIGAGIGGTVISFGLTKSGPGILSLTNAGTTANNYTGVTTINGGTLTIDALNRLGASSGITLNGGTLNQTVNFSITQPITIGLSGGTLNYNSTAGSGGWSSATAVAFLGSGSRTLTLGGTDTGRVATLTGSLGDGGGPTSLTINGGSTTSIFQLSGANSTYSGPTTIVQGVLRINAANALSPASNVTFNGGANRAILEYTTAGGNLFTSALGTLPGQVQWLGNGGFSGASAGTTLTVNLGGLATPATVVWNSGSFVPTGSTLQFAQNAANQTYGSGTVNFQNPIDLAGGSRTIDVLDNGGQSEAILSGLVSGTVGSILNKTGLGNLTLTADNSSSTNVAVIVASGGGAVIFQNANAVPGTTGATVTITGGSVVLTGSTNPLAAIGSRIVATSAGAIALDTNSSATLDFSSFSALTLGAFNPTMGQPVIFTGSINPNSNTYRLSSSRATVFTAAITGNNLINFGLDQGRNVLVLPVTNQLPDGGGARNLVIGSGETYITSYNTFTGGTKVGQLTGQVSNANLGIGHDAALGAGTIAFNPAGTTASTGFWGGINGDHVITNNVTVGAANWVSSGNLASDGITNSGAMTYVGTVALGTILIFPRTNASIFLGNITATGTIAPQVTGAVSFLTTPAGAVNKTFAVAVSIAIGGNLIIDSNASLGSGTNTLTIGTGTAAATNTFLRIQAGTASAVTLTGRAVAIGTNFQPIFDIPGGPVTGVTSNLVLPGVVSGSTTALIGKIGTGTLTFQGANTFNGTNANGLQIFGGTVLVDTATVAAARATNSTTTALALGTSAAATAATFGGGGTFTLNAGGNAGAQTFTILSTAAKDNTINLTATGAGSAALTFNGVTFNRSQQGGTLAINMSGTSSITLTGAITANTGAAVAGAIVLDGGATGNAFAYINGTGWAARNGTNNIVPLGSAGAGSYTANTATVLAGNADMSAGNTALATGTTITSLRFNTAADTTLNLGASNLVTGGILVGTGTGTNNQTISASGVGALQGVAAKDLVVINANNVGDGLTTGLLTISAPILDNGGATALTKSGPGTVVLSGNNAFTGQIYLNGGVLSVATAGTAAAANPLGQGASAATNINMNGGTLRYTGAGSTTTDRGATFNSFSNIEVTAAGGTFVMSGPLAGFAGGVGLLNKTGPGALSLGGALDNANLSVLVTAGTLNLDKASTAAIHAISGGTSAAALVVKGGTVKITGSGGDQINNGSAVVVNAGGTFDFNGQGETFDALGGNGLVTNTGANGAPITLVLGDATVAGQANNGANTPNAAAAGVAAAGLNSFSGSITDNGTNRLAINKSGYGMQIFTGTANTYSGDTTVTSGVLRLGALNVLPSGAGKGNVALTGNTVIFGLTVPGTLDMGGFNQAINGLTGTAGSIVTNTPPTSVSADQVNTIQIGNNDQTSQFDGIFQDGYVIQPGTTPVGRFGFVAVQKVGAGVLTLTGTSTSTGAVTIDEGRIDLNNATGNALSANVTINTGGTLKLLANNQIADGNSVTTSGGTFDLNGRTETAGVILTFGSIIDSAGGGALSSGSNFDLQAGTVSARLSGTSGLAKTGGGTVTLGGGQTHDFSGTTAITAGTLVLAGGASISASSGVAITGTAKFYVNGSTAAAVPISVASGTTLGGTGVINGTVTVAAGTGVIEAGQSGAGSLTVQNLTFTGGGKFLVYNINAGASASLVNVMGTLSGSATPNSVLIDAINSGSVANGTYKLIGYNAIVNTSAFTTGSIGGLGGRQTPSLDFGVSTPNFISLTITGDAPKWNGYTGTLADSIWHIPAVGAPTNWKLITGGGFTDFQANDQVLFDDTLDLGNNPVANVVLLSEGNVAPASTTFNNTSVAYSLSGAFGITGATSLVKNGTGTLTIGNANTFTGGVVINAGVVKLGTAGAIGTGNALQFGASAAAGTKLQLFGFDASVTGLSTNALPGSPVIENGDATTNSVLTVSLASGINTFAGVFQNGGAATLGLTKQGGGTLILTGTNTATGGNTVSGGTLQIGNGGTAGILAGDTGTAASANLDFNRSDASAYGGNVTGAGTVNVAGGGTLSITGDVGHSGGTTIAATTTLQIGNGGATGALSGAGTITDNGTLAFNRTGSTVVQAPIIGLGNLSVGNGTTVGTLILTGNNGYSGTTTIAANATLKLGNATASGSLGTAASITDNGTFAYGRSDAQTFATVFNGTGAVRIVSGTLTLTGNNNATYSGGTTVDNGAVLIVGDVTGTAGAIPGFNAAGTGSVVADGSITFRRTGTNTFDNLISGAATGNVTLAAGSWTFTNTTSYLGSTAILNGATLNIAAGTGTGVGAGAIADAGTLVFNRATPYTLAASNLVTGAGAVTLASSAAVIPSVNNQFNTTGVLNLGAAQGSATAVSLDLSAFNATFGSLNVQTNTATANTITIGAGRTLTLTGGVAAVVIIGANSGVGTVTNLNFAGSGNFTVTRPGGTFQIGGATGATNTGSENVNMGSLTNFTVDLGATGVFRIGASGTTTGTVTETLTGALNNTLTAGTVSIGDSSGFGGGAAFAKILNLGGGTNAINANTINIADTNNANSARGSGLVQFTGAGGTLTVRSVTGASGVTNLNMVNTSSATATQHDAKLLLTGHLVDAPLNNLVMSSRSGGTTLGSDATLSFDTGTLSANNLAMVARTGITLTSGASSGTLNLGGGTVTFGTVTMAVNSVGTVVSTGAVTATMNITGAGTTTITTLNMANDAVGAATSTSASTATVNIGVAGGAPNVALGTVTMAVNSSASTSATTSTGNINIAAGNVTAAAISMANTTNNAANVSAATLAISGGTLTLGGNITTVNGVGTENTTLTLTGGTLDMGGFSIGSAAGVVGSGSGTLSFQVGTLKNLFELNGGTTALAKNTAGTLILSGTNSYTGGTVVNGGTLLVNNTGGLSGTGTGAVSVTGGVGARGTLGGTGSITGGVTLATNGATTFAQGATINPGAVGTAGTLAINTAGLVTNNFSNLTFDLNSAVTVGGGVNDLIATDVLPVIGATTQVNINTLGTLSVGNYTLISGYTGTLANFGNLTLNPTFTGTGATHTGVLLNSSGALQLFVVNTGFATAYWDGSIDANWNTLTPVTAASNWRDAATGGNDVFGVPNSATDVHFNTTGAGNLATNLGRDFSIKTLTFDATATADVSISGNTLTITPASSSTGVTMISGAGNVTINSAIVLGAAQTWTVNSIGKTLTVAGVTNGAFDVTFSGAGNFAQTGVWGSGSGGIIFGAGFSGTATLNQANTFTGALAVNGGTVVGTSAAGALGAGALSLGGGNLKLTNPTATNLNFARNATVIASSTITSDVTGAGTAGNTYTFATLGISGQTLTIQGGANVNSGTAGVTFSGTTTFSTANPTFTINNPAGGGTTLLTLGAVANSAFTATITGSGGGLAQTGVWGAGAGGITLDAAYTGTVTLSQVNTFTGPVTINGGALTATVQQALGLGTGTTTVASGGTLNLTNTGTVTYTALATVAGGGIINLTLGSGTTIATLGGNYSGFTGTTNVGVGGTGGKASLNGLDNAAATVNVVANGTVYISAAVTKNAAIILNGGDTGESLGQLRLEASAIWAGAVTLAGPVTGAGDFSIGGNTTTGTISGNIGQTGGTQPLSKGGSGIMILSGANTYTGMTTVAAGTLQIGAGSTTGSLNPTGGVVNNATLTFNRSNTLTQSTGIGAISGPGAVIKNGTGTLVLDGSSTFTGAMTVNAGAVTASGNFNNGAGITTIASAAATSGLLYVPAGGSYATTTYNVGGNATGIGSVVINGGTASATTASAAAGYTGGNAGYGGLFLSNGGSLTMPRFDTGTSVVATAISVNQISGGTFTTNGDFILIRNGHGELTITGGSLVRTVPSNTIALGELGIDATMNVAGGIVDNTGQTVQFGRVAASVSFASLNLNAGSLVTNAIAATAANITGAARVNFNGGELKASAASTTFLPSGVTLATSNAAFGTYTGGAVVNTNGFNITFAEPVLAPTGNGIFGVSVGAPGSGYIGAPLVQIVGDGTGATGYAVVDLDPASGTFGQLQSVVITNPGIGYTTTPSVNLLGGGGSGASATASAPSANASGGLVKNGAGILTLGVAGNTYTGGTTINAGTVALGVNDALANAGNVTVSGGTFDVATFTDTVATVSLQGGAITGSTGVLTSSGNYDLRSGTVNFTGAGGLAGTGSANKTTAGTVTLTNNGLGGTFANAVNVNGGTLAFSTSAQLGSAAATNTIGINGGTLSYTGATAVDLTATRTVTIGAGHGTLDASQSTGALTVSGGVAGTGNLTKTGPGTVIIAGTTNLAGASLTVSDGTLRAGFGTNGVGTITIGATGNLDLNNSAIEALVLNNSVGALTLNGGAKLGFELTNSLTNDSIALGASGTAITGGTITLNFSGTVANGTYNLLSSTVGGLNGATYVLGSAPSGFNYTINKTDFLVSLAAAPFVPRYWTGSEATTSWATVNGAGPFTTNFSTDAAGTLNAGSVPGAAHTAVFSATAVLGAPTSISTTLDGTYTIDGLQFIAAPAGVTAVTINRGTAGSTLTLAPISTSGGIFVAANAGNETINAPLIASATQTWNIDGTGANGSSLTIGGATASVAFNAAVTKSGGGALTLASANTGTAAFTLSGGTLNINNGTALGAGTFTIGSGTTIDNTSAGLVTLTNNNVQNWTGGFTFTGTQDLNLGIGAVTLGASGGVLTSTAGRVLTVGGVIDDGASTFSLSKVGAGTLVLNGSNAYDGLTDLLQGVLTLTGNNSGAAGGVSMAATSTLNLADAAALGTGTFTINGGTLDNTKGTALTLSTNNAQNWNGSFTFTGSNNLNLGSGAVTLGANPTVTVTANVLTASSLGDGASVFGITKDGPGTLELGGVSTYKGPTVINRGTLKFLTSQNLSANSNTLVFGAALASPNVGTLDLSIASATFGGATTVQTNSATANTITIGPGQTLRLNGAVTVGYLNTAVQPTKLTVSGAGTFTIGAVGAPTNASVTVGVGGTTDISNPSTLDLSGVSTFYANLGVGIFRIGETTNAGGGTGTGGGGSTVILAPTSTLVATTVTMDSATSTTQTLKLGSGTNEIDATTVSLGSATSRATGSTTFNTGSGTLKIRNLAGTGRAALNLTNSTSTTGANLDAQMNVTGHGADLLLGTFTIAARSGQSAANGTGTFSFDTNLAGLGLDATTVVISSRTGTTATTGSETGTLNLMVAAGTTGTATIGTLNMAVNSASTATTSNQAKATLNIGGAGTVNITAMTMGNNSIGGGATAQTAAPVEALVSISGSTTAVGTLTMNVNSSVNTGTGNTSLATLNVSAGTLNVGAGGILMNTISGAGASGSSTINVSGTAAVTTGTAGINMANASNATATGTSVINITGGTLTMGGNLAYTAGVGAENTTLTLNGGILDMGGFSIGAATTLVGSGTGAVNFQSGTLKNILQLNGGGGTGTLSKTTSGTLILTGTNAYTGLTDVTAGIVRVQSPTGLGTSAGATAVTSGATLQLEAVNVGAENLTLNGTGTALQGALSATGTAQNSGTVTLASASSVGTATLADNLTLSGVVQGSVALTKVGAGTLNLSGPNTYNGGTNIEAGTVNANTVAAGAGAQSLGAGTTVNLGVAATSSGTLNYTGVAATLDKNINALGNGSDTVRNSGTGLLTLSGTLTKNGTTLTLDNGANGIKVTGSIVGTNSNSDLTVTNGTTTLSNNNPYNGATVVTSTGTLAVIAGGSLSGTTAVNVNDGGKVILNTAAAANPLNGAAAVTVGGGTSGVLSMQGVSGSTGTLAGALALSSSSSVDFGTGDSNKLTFASLASLGATGITIAHWTGSVYSAGTGIADTAGATQDRLLFTSGLGGAYADGQQFSQISFTDDAGAFLGIGQAIAFGTPGGFEIVPVPEPATTALIGAVALCALIRRRGPAARTRLARK
jgi:autotransporter-associated beta strand protein